MVKKFCSFGFPAFCLVYATLNVITLLYLFLTCCVVSTQEDYRIVGI